MSDDDATTIVGALGVVLALISVVLRFYARHYKKAGFGWDDWTILVGLLATITTDVVVLCASSIDPTGAEAASDPTRIYTPADVLYTKLDFICTVLYFTVTSTTKMSILFMYNRLFSVDISLHRQVIALAIAVTCFWIGCTVADLLNCIPLEWTWVNSQDDPRYCFNYNIFWLASGIVEAFIDVLIIALPIRAVSRLRLNRSKKIAVTAVFLLGVFVIISGVVKVILSYVPGSREPSFGRTEVWTTVHCCTGIICACLPVCWPLFVRLTNFSFRTWPSVSSLRKHWYSFSGWSSMERRSVQRVNEPELGGDESAGWRDLELPTYNPDPPNFAAPSNTYQSDPPIYIIHPEH
ncbi:hypothetical protein F4810DRAFT_693973 [Camillea tinctor]|nr:hypothetical protein F4810DRAFT_693973 [Camillea tinctor]